MKLRNSFHFHNPVRGTSQVTSRTIGSRLFRYFAMFSVTIMLLLWLLQILFMQTFYQEMKRNELEKIAETIESGFGTDTLFDTVTQLTGRSDLYVQIMCGDTVVFETSSGNPGDRMTHFANTYDCQLLKDRLISSDLQYTVVKLTSKKGNSNSEAMIYASILDDGSGMPPVGLADPRTYLFIYSPLSAVGTTIDILAEMLIIVTVISIIFALFMSIIISKRLARPLHSITKSAARLAEGDYSSAFDGSGYAETEELAATLNYAAGELSKSDKLQKDLVANVSHDLKTPLTMVKSYAEMIRDLSGDNPEKRNRHLQVIINEADRLNSLVNDLTLLSKMQANVDTPDLQPVDLAYLARETMESFSLHAEQDRVDFHVESEGNTIATADEKKIRQVFSNLIGNAVRYSGEQKNIITVRVKELPETIRCEVEDHGQGIPKEDLESIWDRYYQSSSNHSRTLKGSGLGLSIVKQIFLQHNAKYGVESTENQGSTFWFELKK